MYPSPAYHAAPSSPRPPAPLACARERGSLASLALILVVLILAIPAPAQADTPRLLLATTLGLQGTGLIDRLVPLFERQTGRQTTVVAVSAPQALALGIRGEVDVLLLDADEDEETFVAAGHGAERRLILHADDVMLGPRDDPARVREAAGVEDALRRIVSTDNTWVSRADNSGLFQIEKRLWREAGIDPRNQPWYVPIGQGMLPTLAATSERQAYTLVDRLTFLERQSSLDLALVLERQPELLRLFHAITINPAKGAWIDEAGARAFVDVLLGADAQAVIRDFAVDRFGQPIFVPDAGRTEQELRPARRPSP